MLRITISACLCSVISLNAFSQQQEDSLKTVIFSDVVVSASRLEEDLSISPVTIEKISINSIRQSASPSFYDALENVRGIQMLVPSLGFKVINTRGFGNTTNVRFVQMVDGMDIQAPHLGTPIANMLGPTDLDIQNVEIIPGTASALYGMNAINGLANFTTKDPFKSEGISFRQLVGVNRVDTDGKLFSESNLRWAKMVGNKFAFKINATYMTGTDWIADDQTDLNPNANASTGLTGSENPALDPVNSYGNESPNRRTLTLGGKNYVVARTGYYEKDVVDYNINNIKADVALHYAFTPATRLIYTYRIANLDNIYQRSNRFRLEDYRVQQHGLSFRSKSINAMTYLNLENTGNSYNARSMAENIDRHFKPDAQWFSEYTQAYNAAIAAGGTATDAHDAARAASDQGRPVPGSAGFNNLIDELRTINNWDVGAALRVKARMLHAEAQFNLTAEWLAGIKNSTGIDLLTGFDHRTYNVVPDGNYFINPEQEGHNLTYSKTGGFIQLSKNFRDKLRTSFTLRADKNDYFDLKWNPRITAVYSITKTHHLRFSYQAGYRFPSLFEGFSNVNSGGVKRVGGLPVMSSGIFENAYLRASIDAFQRAVIADVNQSGMTKEEAILANEGLLVKNDYSYIEPEHIQSFEFGYRGGFLNEDLQVDLDFYYNRYDDFIAQVEMNIPKTAIADSIPFYLNDRSKQDRYRLWTNSKTTAYNFGAGFGMRYNLPKNYRIQANLTYSKLQRTTSNDGLEDGFNTPEWIVNAAIANPDVINNFGFNVTFRWQSSYYWQSFLVNGDVPAYSTIDAQVTKQLKKVSLRVGGSNVLNDYYNSYLGGPGVGGFYYLAITYGM